MAERLNNTLAELHALKLEHQREKDRFTHEMDQAREEIERLKGKNKELRRQIR
jgi:HAMP domain-containing protein